MSAPDADILFALELFDSLGALTARRMSGGACLRSDGVIAAPAHADGSTRLKGSGPFADRIAAEGGTGGSIPARAGNRPPCLLAVARGRP